MNIVFVLFDNVTQLDFAGPVQFLSRLPGSTVQIVSKDGKAVTTDCGFSIVPNASFADCRPADIICVPGGHGVRQASNMIPLSPLGERYASLMALAIRRSGEGELARCLHRRSPSPTTPRPVGQGFVSSPLKGRG
jgi:transcriptional regulator GlxA family with amidase domain